MQWLIAKNYWEFFKHGTNGNKKPNKETNKETNEPDKTNNSFLTGLVAGSIGAFAVYPIDVVKTRMQNQTVTNRLYSNGFDCWKQLWKQGGFKSFYRGCVPQMIGVAPEKAIKLLAYTYVTKSNPNELSTHIAGGLLAGTCQVMVTSPYEMIKINLQMNNKINYGELLNIKKLYTGASACFLRDIPFSGIYFPLYWHLKEKENFNPFVAGTLAGAPAAFFCTPADVVKTRMQTLLKQGQTNGNGIVQVATSIYKSEGYTAFWKGGGWRVLRSSPQFGITLLVFEYLKTFSF
jgi:solute carrier family 25 aspartate/glutamate transporter 12/13